MNNKLLFVVLFIAGALLRLLPHGANFVPLGAIALVSGSYFSKKYAWILPISIMLTTDIIFGSHPTMIWVYGSYILITLLGSTINNKRTLLRIIPTSIISSVLFFAITNFGVWATTSMYTKDLHGLVQCFTLAIPFFRNTLVSDFLFSLTLFPISALVKSGYFHTIISSRFSLR